MELFRPFPEHAFAPSAEIQQKSGPAFNKMEKFPKTLHVCGQVRSLNAYS